MNYIDLINNMWNLREQGLLTSLECDLYLYLVHRCNRLGWNSSFGVPTDVTCAVLGINRNTLLKRRSRLKQVGLIAFKEGERKTKPPMYTLCIPEVTSDTFMPKPVVGAVKSSSKPKHLCKKEAENYVSNDWNETAAKITRSSA